MQKFNAPCNFNGTVSPFSFWISDEYTTGKDPLFFQKDWLQKVRGGMLDPKISEGIIQIARIAEKNKLSFEYLFGIAMNAALEKYNSNQNNNNLNNENLKNDIDEEDDENQDDDTDFLDNDEEEDESEFEDNSEDDEEDESEFEDNSEDDEDDEEIELNFK